MLIIIKILGFVFFISGFILVFLLINLAIRKKRLGIYINQINKTGTIERIYDSVLLFDIFITLHIFDKFPNVRNDKNYSKFKIILDLKDKIDLLTMLVKFIAPIFGITVILLIVLLNVFGEKLNI